MRKSGAETTPDGAIERYLGEKLKRCRERKALSQMDVGIAIGISQSQVGRYERGERALTVGHLVQLSDLFEEPLSYFLDDLEQFRASAAEYRPERQALLIQTKELLYEQDDQTLAVLSKLMARHQRS